MNIQFPNDHGRSTLQKLNQFFNRGQSPVPESRIPGKLERDTFEKSPVQPTETENSSSTISPEKNSQLNISFQFDLFYELSTKVEAKMGKTGANRFAEVSGEVAETFMGSFNLKIDGVGSFFKNTDSALNISPETTNEFFDAVEGLTDMSPESLENFLQETEDFFGELESVYGEAGGTFDQIKEQMQQQATDFFAEVKSAREEAASAMDGALTGIQAEPAISGEIPASAETESGNEPGLIKMTFKPDLMIPQDNYQDFIKKFIDYTERFKQQLLESFFNRKPATGESIDLLDTESIQTGAIAEAE